MTQEISRRIQVCEDCIGLDGIKFRGKGPVFPESGFWHRESGNEIDAWYNSNFRLLELTKDLNDDEVWDIRTETGLKNHEPKPQIGHRWYRNLMTFEYLLVKVFNEGVIPSYSDITDDELIRSFNSSVSARVNCKKTAGGGVCPRSVLNFHINAYGDILRQQVEELNPNIIYIGGCDGNLILDKIVRPVYGDLQREESSGWLYYSEARRTVVVNGYNPGMRKNLENVYNEMSIALRSFSQTTSYSNFIKTYALQFLKG